MKRLELFEADRQKRMQRDVCLETTFSVTFKEEPSFFPGNQTSVRGFEVFAWKEAHTQK